MKTNSNILSRKIIETQLKIYVREREWILDLEKKMDGDSV